MHKQKNKKRFLSGIMLFFLIFSLFNATFFYPKKADAALADKAGQAASLAQSVVNGLKDAFNWAKDRAEIAIKYAREHAVAVAGKVALHNFLTQLSVDTATWLATGDEGNKPMFITEGWGAYLENAADRAAGDFIMTMGTEWDKGFAISDGKKNYTKCYKACIDECEPQDWQEQYTDCWENAKPCIESCQTDYDAAMKEAAAMVVKFDNKELFSSNSNGEGTSIVNFLCEPDLDVKLRIMAGITEIDTPRRPKCIISKAKENWDEFINDDDFLSNFQTYWDPSENDVGVALSLYSNFLSEKESAKAVAEAERIANKGIKSVNNLVGGILTPAVFVEKMGLKPIEEGADVEKENWRDIAVNAIGTFAETLMGELLNKWIKEGLSGGSSSSSSSGNSFNWLTDNIITEEKEKLNDIKLAKEKFTGIFKPELGGGKSYSILRDLMICPDPLKPGPTDCVIDEEFSHAIEQRLTVQEAIDEGYIKIDVPFGFINKELEPEYNQGYPYRSLIILRKYRIIPVGWELAALFVGKYGGRTYNIQEIVDDYDSPNSPFYKLIDPSWVLKAPEMYCSIEGYGEKIVSEEIAAGMDTNEDGDYNDEGDLLPKILIDRDTYCADEKSCIKEDDNGNCLFYGYCSEEKRLFDFQGDKCEPQFSNCQGFRSYKGGQVYYTKTSLDFTNCDESSAGCDWYCTSRNPSDNAWACYEPGRDIVPVAVDTVVLDINDIDQDGDDGSWIPPGPEEYDYCTIPAGGVECFLDDSNARLTTGDMNITTATGPLIAHNLNSVNDIYLDNGAKECQDDDEGCYEYIRTKPNLGTNLLLNGSFEKEFDENGDGTIAGSEAWYPWQHTGTIDTANAYFGSKSFVADSPDFVRQVDVDTGYSLAGRKFILSFYAKGTCGTAKAWFKGVFPDDGNACVIDDNCGSKNCAGAAGCTTIWSDEIQLEDSNDWQRHSVAFTFPYFVPSYVTDIDVEIGIPFAFMDVGCSIDGVQLEEARGIDNSPSGYSEYQENNLLYIKKAPHYYDCDKYTNIIDYDNEISCEDTGAGGGNGLWREKAGICVEGGNVKCEEFAFECNINDVGCDLYKPKNGDPGIPAVVSSEDFCPSSCDGYSTYKQSKTFFDLEKFPEYFIAANEKKCPASDEGCSEFTNLDKIDESGEALEYYAYLRPCKAIDGSCSSFYSWVGSETSGFQLKAHLLEDANFDGTPDMLLNGVVTYITDAANCALAGHVWTGQCMGGPINMLGECDDPNWDMQTNNENDVISNPECYEFYSENETVSYIHYRNTKTCSDNCSPYRKTRSTPADCGASNNWGDWKQIDLDECGGGGSCEDLDSDGTVETCVDGPNDGNFCSAEVEYCLYDGLAEESISCSSSNDGCFEYKGSTSNNVRYVVNDNFESGIINWVADEGLGGGVMPGLQVSLSSSAESLARGGHSLKVTSGDTEDRVMYPLKMECDTYIDNAPSDPDPFKCDMEEGCECQVSGETVCMVFDGDSACLYKSSLMAGRSYIVSFWGKGSGDLTVRFSSAAAGDEFASGNISFSPAWMEYSLGPVFIHDNWDMTADSPSPVASFNDDIKEVIEIFGFDAGDSYIDNFILKEIRDNLFLVKPTDNIWNIPDICDQDNDGNYAPQFMLGCSAYRSEVERTDVYLKSFHHLCSEDVVGCEALIDTQNSSSPIEEIWNSGSLGEIVVPEDKFISLVNDRDKSCRERDKGCTALGLPSYSYNQHITYNDPTAGNPDFGRFDDSDDLYKYTTKYLINDPDSYDDSLCDYDNTGCDQFTTDTGGEFYFKDPLSQRINNSPLICEYKSAEFSDKGGWYIKGTPQNEPNCPIDITGTGIEYPAQSTSVNSRLLNWTGQCSAKLDSCTEYMDPISLIDKNIVFNSDFAQDVDGDGIPDGWAGGSGSDYSLEEILYLDSDTVYTIVAQNSDVAVAPPYQIILDGPGCNLTTPDNSIIIDTFASRATLSFDGPDQFSGRVYSGGLSECNLSVSEDFVLGGGKIKILKTGLYYYLDDSINKAGCNGYVDYNDGCVIFNSRDIDDGIFGNFADVVYDADLLSQSIPTPELFLGQNDANLLIKTRPDRECGEWLYCKSVVKSEDSDGNERQMCLEVGLCDSINSEGLCNGFPVSTRENQMFSSDNFRDSSGYSKVGIDFGDLNFDSVFNEIVVGNYPFEKMVQSGGKVLVPNGDFEVVAMDGSPVGWGYGNTGSYNSNYFSTVQDPVTSQKEGLDLNAPSGRSYLKIDGDESIKTEMIDVNFFTQTGEMTNYFVDASINTRNIYGGNALIEILSYNSMGALIDTTTALTLSYGNDWRSLTNVVSLSGGTSWVEVRITADDSAEGYFYVDNINIRPVLTVTDGLNNIVVSSAKTITSWNFGESMDSNLVPQNCGVAGLPEGTRHDIVSATDPFVTGGNDWMQLPGSGIAYGFGSNKATLDGTGGAYDGMLYSDDIVFDPGDEASILHLWRNVRMRSFDIHQDLGVNGAPDAYRLEIRDGDPASPTYFDVLDTVESWDGGNQGYIGVDSWTFRGSIDSVLGPCGESTLPNDPGGEYFEFNAIPVGDLDVPLNPLYDPIAYSFAEDVYPTFTTLDGANTGNGYDGMLYSNVINLPSSGVSDIHIWRNVRLRSFDLNAGTPDTPDAYYLEIRDANDINNVLEVIEFWESPANGSDEITAFASGAITHDISHLAGQSIVVTMQIVGHTGSSCDDGAGDDHVAQIGDVYVYVDEIGDGNANIFGDINIDISSYAQAGQDIILSAQLIGHRTQDCTDGNSDDGLLQIGNVFILDGEDIDVSRYVNQTCRAYPKADSLACDYHDEEGIKNIGWKGYCLEYDRTPGNPDQCLMWWPVDLLLGEGSNEEEIGYRGKHPVYYGVGSKNMSVTTVDSGLALREHTRACEGINGIAYKNDPDNFSLDNSYGIDLKPFLNINYIQNIKMSDDVLFWSSSTLTPSNQIIYNGNPAWYKYIPVGDSCIEYAVIFDSNGDLVWVGLESDDTSRHGKLFGTHTATFTITFSIPYVSELIQVVTPFGNNKYWSDRVYQESDYIVPSISPFAQYIYDDTSPPFGSIASLIPDNDPGQWTFGINNYPNFFIDGNNNIIQNSGNILGKNWTGMASNLGNLGDTYLGRLFAKSYGHWTWNNSNSRFEKIYGYDWLPPNNICTGDPPVRPKYDSSTLRCNSGNCFSCPGNTCDWCGVPPRIENVKLDGKKSGNYYINNSGTVNFAFNSIVDINQSPLVMYVVDWGDGTDSAPNYVLGSGISINHKPSEENPHSFFHLYGYWDILGKDTQSQTIDCAGAGQDLFLGAAQCLADSPCCATRVRTKIKDNWGWCNDGTNRDDCDTSVYYNGYVIVSQFQDTCVPSCDTSVGCRTAAPLNSVLAPLIDPAGACCNQGSCYQCNAALGYEWDEGLGQCVTPCVEACAGDVGCWPGANTPQNSSNIGGICCDPLDNCFNCDPGYSWNGSQCVTCSDTCSGIIDIGGIPHQVAGCNDPLNSSPVGSAGYIPGGDNCCGTDVCYYCPAGQYWNGSSCELIGSGMCGDQNGAIFGSCDPPCFSCNLGPGSVYSCEPPTSPQSYWDINDTNADTFLTTGEDVTGYVCVPDSSYAGTVWSLYYDGIYQDANDCDDVATPGFPSSNCKVLPGCDDNWYQAYDPLSSCGISNDQTWNNMVIPNGQNYIAETDTYTDCCNTCDQKSMSLRFEETSGAAVADSTTDSDIIIYNNDDCNCVTWKDAGLSSDFGCNDHVWMFGNVCDDWCLGNWVSDGTTSCCIDDQTSTCTPGDVNQDWGWGCDGLIGCRAADPGGGSIVISGVCCPGYTCYDCPGTQTWNGLNCI